jgi:hypothetical protein
LGLATMPISPGSDLRSAQLELVLEPTVLTNWDKNRRFLPPN